MNNSQLFDEHIKEQFSDFAPDVHPRIWENILAEKERRKPVGFWFTFLNRRNIILMLGLLLAGGSGAWLFINNSSAPGNKKELSRVAFEKNRKADGQMTNIPGIPNPDIEIKSAALPDNMIDVNKGSDLPGGNPVSNLHLSSKSATKVRVYSAPQLSEETNEPAITNKKAITASGTLLSSENTVSEIGPGKENLPVQGSLLARLIFGAQKITATQKEKGEIKKPLIPFGFLPECPAMEKNTSGNKKYFELYGGPDFAMRSLKDTGNSAYLQKRKESTKVSSAFSAGIRYTRVFNNSMSIRAGVNFSQINEKFTFLQGNLVQITYIIDANGDTTGSYITTGTRYKTTHNKFRSIDVPLLIGYEMGNGRLHANINVGPVVNVYSWQNGEVLDTSFNPVSITTGKGSSPYQFKTNAGIGMMGAVSLYYKLNDKLHILAEPYFRYNLSQLNKENLTLKQKYNTVGMRLGIRIDLR